MDPFTAGDSGPGLEDTRAGPDLWLGPDSEAGRVCGYRPGVRRAFHATVYPVSVLRRLRGGA